MILLIAGNLNIILIIMVVLGNQNNMRFVVEDDKEYGAVGNRSIFDSIP
jgi:hypothetical protein